MALGITVPYSIVCDSGAQTTGVREGVPREGPWAEVKFKCYWVDRQQLVNDLLGTWIVSGTLPSSSVTSIWNGGSAPTSPTIVRQPPYRYPAAPAMFCTDILSIEPLGKPGPWGLTLPWLTGEMAVVTARFSLPGWTIDGSDQSGQPYTRLSSAGSAEFLTFPDTTYLINGSIPTGVAQGIIMPQIDFTWTRVRLPYIPDAFMATYAGCVNSDSFAVSRSFTAAPGTLLFMPGQVSVDGYAQAFSYYEFGFTLSYTVDYHFLYRPLPWNYVCVPQLAGAFGSVFQPVYGSATGDTPYPVVAFTGLFP